MRQLIYAVAWSRRGPTKVGITDQLTGRLCQLQTGCPYRLRVFGAYWTVRAGELEARILGDLEDVRLVGEWLKLGPELVNKHIVLLAGTISARLSKWAPTEGQKERRVQQLNGRKHSNARVWDAYDEMRRLRV